MTEFEYLELLFGGFLFDIWRDYCNLEYCTNNNCTKQTVDRHGDESVGKSGSGILVQVPLHQQIILQQPVKVEKEKEIHPLVAFLEKLKRFKNTFFPPDPIEEKSDKLNALFVYANPKVRKLR